MKTIFARLIFEAAAPAMVAVRAPMDPTEDKDRAAPASEAGAAAEYDDGYEVRAGSR